MLKGWWQKERKGEENAWIDNSQRMQGEISTKRCKQIASVFPRVFEEEKERHQGNEIIYNRINTSLLKEMKEGKTRLWVLHIRRHHFRYYLSPFPHLSPRVAVFVSFCMKALEVKMVRQRIKGGKISHYELWPCFPFSSQKYTKRCGKRALCDTTNGVIFIDGTKQANTTRVEETTLAFPLRLTSMMTRWCRKDLFCFIFSVILSPRIIYLVVVVVVVISIPIFLAPV